jgi:hypothetical protein
MTRHEDHKASWTSTRLAMHGTLLLQHGTRCRLRSSLSEGRSRFPSGITELGYLQVVFNKNLIRDIDLRIFIEPLFELFSDLS